MMRHPKQNNQRGAGPIWTYRSNRARSIELASVVLIVLTTAIVLLLSISTPFTASYIAGALLSAFYPAGFLRREGSLRAARFRRKRRIDERELALACTKRFTALFSAVLAAIAVAALLFGHTLEKAAIIPVLVPYHALVAHRACGYYLAKAFYPRLDLPAQLLTAAVCLVPVAPLVIYRRFSGSS